MLEIRGTPVIRATAVGRDREAPLTIAVAEPDFLRAARREAPEGVHHPIVQQEDPPGLLRHPERPDQVATLELVGLLVTPAIQGALPMVWGLRLTLEAAVQEVRQGQQEMVVPAGAADKYIPDLRGSTHFLLISPEREAPLETVLELGKKEFVTIPLSHAPCIGWPLAAEVLAHVIRDAPAVLPVLILPIEAQGVIREAVKDILLVVGLEVHPFHEPEAAADVLAVFGR